MSSVVPEGVDFHERLERIDITLPRVVDPPASLRRLSMMTLLAVPFLIYSVLAHLLLLPLPLLSVGVAIVLILLWWWGGPPVRSPEISITLTGERIVLSEDEVLLEMIEAVVLDPERQEMVLGLHDGRQILLSEHHPYDTLHWLQLLLQRQMKRRKELVGEQVAPEIPASIKNMLGEV